MTREARWTGRAMGTSFTMVVHHHDRDLLDAARRRLVQLEQRWSRFLPHSEISILNRAHGAPVIVSPDTFAVIGAAVEACILTEGRFDPTVHDSLVDLGYDDTFGLITGGRTSKPQPAPGVAGIDLDEELLAVRLPAGVRLDLGGIGKGTAADLICTQLVLDGARGAAVSIGGDLRVMGTSPSGAGWSAQHTDHDLQLDLPTLDDGGVCTSTTQRRRWSLADGAEAHHLLDPATGAPTTGLTSVTVVAATAQQAEVLTKVAMVAGADAPAVIDRFGVIARCQWSDQESLIST